MSEEMYLCELCQRRFLGESYLKHLDIHSPEEVRMLQKLTALEVKDRKKYEELCWELVKVEYYHNQEVDRDEIVQG